MWNDRSTTRDTYQSKGDYLAGSGLTRLGCQPPVSRSLTRSSTLALTP